MHPSDYLEPCSLTFGSDGFGSLRRNTTDLYLPVVFPVQYTPTYEPAGVLSVQNNRNSLPVVTTTWDFGGHQVGIFPCTTFHGAWTTHKTF